MKIEFDSSTNVMAVDGVQIHLDLLKQMANPDPSAAYQMVRVNDVVFLTKLREHA